MTKERSSYRVTGPYQDTPTKWRLLVYRGKGKPERQFCKSKEEAEREKALLERALKRQETKANALTVGEMIDMYIDHQKAAKMSQWTIATNSERLRYFFEGSMDLPIHALGPEKAERLYLTHAKRPLRNGKAGTLADASHQRDLKRARAMFTWAIKRRIVAQNPFADVMLLGRSQRGKRQLTFDEQQRWQQVAFAWALGGDTLALAALLCLVTGARANEVMLRTVRDIDQNGRVLRVIERRDDDPGGKYTLKTETSKRNLLIPDELVGMLRMLGAGRPPGAFLFIQPGETVRPAKYRLLRKVHAICEKANVPLVCTHSLRGSYVSSVWEVTGCNPMLTAKSAGHGNFGTTQSAYLDADRSARAQSDLMAQRIGLRSLDRQNATELLASLQPETITELRRLLSAGTPTEGDSDVGSVTTHRSPRNGAFLSPNFPSGTFPHHSPSEND